MCLGPKKGAVSGVSQLELGNKGINFEDHGKNRTFNGQVIQSDLFIPYLEVTGGVTCSP